MIIIAIVIIGLIVSTYIILTIASIIDGQHTSQIASI